jgi:hypothetical protein
MAACAVLDRVCCTAACAMLPQDMSVLQQLVLPLDKALLQQSMMSLDIYVCLSLLQQSVPVGVCPAAACAISGCICSTTACAAPGLSSTKSQCYTLNLSLLNLEHVIYKQLQINLKYAFKFVFLFHVLILKAEKHLLPRCKPLFLIWIQGIVNFNFIYFCSCYTNLCCAQPLPRPSPSSVNIAAILLLQCEADGSAV